jgi:glutamate-ammonia-ligase adenylyltransferase
VADFALGVEASKQGLIGRPRVRRLLAALADHSPYLWHLTLADPARLCRLLEKPPDASLRRVLAACEAAGEATEADCMRQLRQAKQEVALLVALCDLGGIWKLGEVTAALSAAADHLIAAALAHLLRGAARAGKVRLSDPRHPLQECGLVVLGLGKLGGGELNYSSDVDLVVLYDPEAGLVPDRDRCKQTYVRLVQDLVRVLQQPTADGYVLRVDLRLRPDPGSTAIAISRESALRYYESFGQNWERAALIKARPVAGDLALGEGFLQELAPFIWRKYFDYAAIADIHAMKRQIHAVRGHATIAVAGHNIKLGRGGIREIEFFVQTQQLIFGGKRPALRGRRTRDMLRQLRRDGWISAAALGELSRAYDFLRRVEHRLQMIADEQTHTLPLAASALERFAQFCGFRSAERFAAVLTRHLRAVVRHYSRLFETAPSLDDALGSLVFTGVEDDPETLATLARLGFKSPASVARMVREWHAGHRSGIHSPRARESLTDLVPKLLLTFSRGSNPDAALAAFDRALVRLPAAAELFAILNASEPLRRLFGDVLGSAPRLAAEVAMRPHLLDGAIDPDRGVSCDTEVVARRVTTIVGHPATTEEFLDRLRDVFHEEHFLIGVALLSGALSLERAGSAYSALAIAIIRAALARAQADFALAHGTIEGASVCVLAMGKLGSREMTASSDLDLVLLYSTDGEPESDGLRPLPASVYFARLMQRLIAHLTVATRRGRLYDVDLRLRPSGRQGPLATRFSSFAVYQRDVAQTWEHMALTRAAVVAGDAAFSEEVRKEVQAILQRPPAAHLAKDVAAMRERIEREKPAASPWDLKLRPGGLVDLEFIAQYLVLQHAQAHHDLCTTETAAIFQRARALDLLAEHEADLLGQALRLFTAITQMLRLALGETPFDAVEPTLQQALAAVLAFPDTARLAEEIAAVCQAVRDIFRGLMRSGAD